MTVQYTRTLLCVAAGVAGVRVQQLIQRLCPLPVQQGSLPAVEVRAVERDAAGVVLWLQTAHTVLAELGGGRERGQ